MFQSSSLEYAFGPLLRVGGFMGDQIFMLLCMLFATLFVVYWICLSIKNILF